MNKPFLAGTIVLVMAGCSHAQIKLTDQTTIVFATVEQGRMVLTARDDFVRSLSPFDRAARLKTDRDVSEEAFLERVGCSVLAWTEAEMTQIESALDEIKPRLTTFSLPLPPTIYLIKTDGREEGRAAYTRDSVIVLPVNMLAASRSASARLICHELFHVLSRHNPALRDRLYEGIGFKKCNEIEFPAALKPRKLTNPDAPLNNHYIEVQLNGESRLAVPILFSRTETYDANEGGEFFRYLLFKFLLVERETDSSDLRPVCDETGPRLVDVRQLAGFWEQVGRNTQYIYHPEEILADNFALLVMQDHPVHTPEVLDRMNAMLSAGPSGR